MDLDHVQSSTQDPSLFTIMYADVYDPEFTKFRRYLDTLARDHGLQYSIRYRPSSKSSTETPLTLSGYGVELALKSTDYIVIDDRDLGHSDDSSASGQTVFKGASGQGLFGDKVPTVEPVREQDLGGNKPSDVARTCRLNHSQNLHQALAFRPMNRSGCGYCSVCTSGRGSIENACGDCPGFPQVSAGYFHDFSQRNLKTDIPGKRFVNP